MRTFKLHKAYGKTYEETGEFRIPAEKGEAFLGGPQWPDEVFLSGPTNHPTAGKVRHILREVKAKPGVTVHVNGVELSGFTRSVAVKSTRAMFVHDHLNPLLKEYAARMESGPETRARKAEAALAQAERATELAEHRQKNAEFSRDLHRRGLSRQLDATAKLRARALKAEAEGKAALERVAELEAALGRDQLWLIQETSRATEAMNKARRDLRDALGKLGEGVSLAEKDEGTIKTLVGELSDADDETKYWEGVAERSAMVLRKLDLDNERLNKAVLAAKAEMGVA